MLNAEHYPDPTASAALSITSKNGGTKKKITYYSTPVYTDAKKLPPPKVKVNNNRSVPISEMTMEDLKQFLKACHKCGGDPFNCLDCVGGCSFGTRAIELLDQMTKGTSPQQVGREKGAQTMQKKAILEYQAAVDSGDPIKYIKDHMTKKSEDPKKVEYAARQKLKYWRDHYSFFVKEVPKQEVKPEPATDDQPHLMQMPCLSKKVAAERAAKEQEEKQNVSAAQLFTKKIESLRKSLAEVQAQINELVSNKDSIEKQIAQIEATAGLLEIAI